MQSRHLIAPLLLAVSSAPSAANGQQQLVPKCGGPFQLCGYVGKATGVQRIARRFEVAKTFDEGLAPVRIEGLYGFIDQTGRIVIAPRFQAAGPFTGGYAEVRLESKSGAIDRSGNMVVPAQFKRLIPFAGGTFIAVPPREGSSPEDSREPALLGLSGAVTLLGLGGGAGLYHLSKGWLTAADLSFSVFDEPARGLIWGREKERAQ